MSDETQILGASREIWRDLFRKFDAVMRLSPWKWFGKADSFAIHPAGSAEPFFIHACEPVSAEGKGMSIIYGWAGDALFRRLRAGMPHAMTRSFEIPFVLCALRETASVTELEKNVAKEAGIDVEGRAEIPVFVSFRPGWMPWHLGRTETESTVKVLDQALGVFLRCENDKDIVYPRRPGIVWVRRQRTAGGKWEEGWANLRPFVEPFADRAMEVPEKSLETLAALPDDMPAIELATDVIPKIALLNPGTVKLRGEDGRVPLGYFFAISPYGVDTPPGEVKDNGVFYPAGDIGSLRKFFPNMLVKYFLSKGHRPREIVVSSPRMMDILRPLQLRVRFKTTFHEKLPNYDRIHALVSKVVADRVK